MASLVDSDAAALGERIAAPVTVLEASPSEGGGMSMTVSAGYLVSVGATAEGEELFATAPVTGTVRLDATGKVTATELPEPAADVLREVNAWGRSLIETGQVQGAGSAGRPPAGTRPTHTVRLDGAGRHVITRVGFSARGAASGVAGPPRPG